MRKVVFSINVSLDGYCDHNAFNPDEDLLDYFTNSMDGVDLIFFGRIMYELMFPYWEDVVRDRSGSPAENRFADCFTKIKRAVASTSFEPPNKAVQVIRKDPAAELLRLKQQVGGNIMVDSISMLPELLNKGLIDECNLIYHPAFVAKGRKLFEEGSLLHKANFNLAGSQMFKSGCVALHYRKLEL